MVNYFDLFFFKNIFSETMLTYINGILSTDILADDDLEDYKNEALWKLSKWDIIEENNQKYNDNFSFNACLAKSLFLLKKNQMDDIPPILERTRDFVIKNLGASFVYILVGDRSAFI